MSLISTLLHKPVPPIHPSARVFRVEEYRDKPSDEDDLLELSDQEFKRTKAARMTRSEWGRNKTDKADARYLDALRDCNLTSKEIAKKISRDLNTVQRQMPILEAKGLVIRHDPIENGANPQLLWGIKP